MAILNKIDLRIMISGHLLDIIVTGIYRSMTLLQPLYVEHFQKGEAPIALFSTFIHIGSMFGGFLCGFLFPKFGLTRPARWAGIIGAAGWCAVSAVLSRKSTILCDCLFFIIGIASGIMEPAYLNSARYNVSPSGMGPVMVIMGGGGATAYLILPKFLNTVIPWLGLKLATASVAVLYCLASIVAFGLLDKPHVSHTKSVESEPDAIEIEKNALGSRTPKKNKNAGKGKLVSRRVLSDASYLLFIISKHLYLIGFGGLSLFLSQLLGSLGFTKATVGNLLLYTGVVEWVARLVHAFWAVNAFDHILSLMTIYTGSGLYYLGICSALLWPQYKWYLTVGFLFFGGCCTSGFGGLMQITLVDITPKQDYTVAFTMQTISSGLGLALGPLYTGLVVDLAASEKSSPVEMGLMQNVTDTGHSGEQTKEFWPAFMTISCFSLLAASLVGALKIVFLRKQRRLGIVTK